MKIQFKFDRKISLIAQAVLIYSWLTHLSPLSVTDTYYSVYLICGVLGILCLADNYRLQAQCPVHRVGMLVSSALFSTAVLLGNYELLVPLSVLQNLLDAVLSFAGGCSIAYQILLWLMCHLPFKRDEAARTHAGLVFWGVFLSISAVCIAYLFFGLYPGVLTTDSFSTVAQILGEEPYNNVMPFWHTVTVGLFMKPALLLFGDINAAVAVFHCAQILFMSACYAYGLMTLYQTGVPVPALAAVYVLYAFMPYNIVYSITLYKDIPFAGAALLFVTALYRLLRDVGRKRWQNYLTFILGALGFSLWRTNGWYAFLVTILVIGFMSGKRRKKLVLIMALVLIFCWVLINPVLGALDVTETYMVEAFNIPMQQMARVLHNQRELTPEETEWISQMFWPDRAAELYDPIISDPVKFNAFRHDNLEYISANLGQCIKTYLSIGMKYPGDYLKAWVDQTRGYWNGGYFYWTYTLKMGVNSFGIQRMESDNIVARLFAAMFRYLEKPEILQCLISIGLYVWTLIACFLINLWKKREELLITIPILVLIAGLWLGTPVYSEFRYAYPMILTMPVILCVTVFHRDEGR